MASWLWGSMRTLCSMVFQPWLLQGNPEAGNNVRRLMPHQKRALREKANVLPFQNYLNEFRMIYLAERKRRTLSLVESIGLRKKALQIWRTMPADQKRNYYDLAKFARKTKTAKNKWQVSKDLGMKRRKMKESQPNLSSQKCKKNKNKLTEAGTCDAKPLPDTPNCERTDFLLDKIVMPHYKGEVRSLTKQQTEMEEFVNNVERWKAAIMDNNMLKSTFAKESQTTENCPELADPVTLNSISPKKLNTAKLSRKVDKLKHKHGKKQKHHKKPAKPKLKSSKFAVRELV